MTDSHNQAAAEGDYSEHLVDHLQDGWFFWYP